mgnify:CR=1 FL=1
MVEGKDLNYKIMVEVNNVNIIFDLLSRSNLVTILSESTTILQNGMKRFLSMLPTTKWMAASTF